jgi:hypothetical protein
MARRLGTRQAGLLRPVCGNRFCGSDGICASVRPSTSEPSKRVEGDEDMTILRTFFARHAFTIVFVPS